VLFRSPVAAGVTTQSAAATSETQARRVRTTVALPLTEAAWTSTRAPRRVMHTSPKLVVRKRSAETFLKFDTSSLGDREMESIKLQLWAVRGKARLNGLVVQQTHTRWKAENISHDNRPRLPKARLNGRARQAPPGRWVNPPLVPPPPSLPQPHAIPILAQILRWLGMQQGKTKDESSHRFYTPMKC